jgi:hypothetical protein
VPWPPPEKGRCWSCLLFVTAKAVTNLGYGEVAAIEEVLKKLVLCINITDRKIVILYQTVNQPFKP